MRKIYQVILTLALVSIGISVYGQTDQVRFEHLSIEEGLSQSSVMAILKDSRGFMWFGTQDGLNRYDGYEFKVYSSTNEQFTVSNNLITSLCEDNFGNIWIGTYNGLNRLNIKNDSVDRVLEIHGSRIKKINQSYNDNEGNIYVGHEYGIAKIEFDNNKNPQFVSAQEMQNAFGEVRNKNIQAILKDKLGNLWLGSANDGLYQFNGKKSDRKSVLHFTRSNSKTRSLANNNVVSLCLDSVGYIWAGTDDGLTRINSRNLTTRHYLE